MKNNHYDLQSLLNECIENIKKKQAFENVKKDEELIKVKFNTEELADSIKRMVASLLINNTSNSGTINDLGEISKYGNALDASWTLDEDKLEIVIDFAHRTPNDIIGNGFSTKGINMVYLSHLLRDEDIRIQSVVDDNAIADNDLESIHIDRLVLTLPRLLDYDRIDQLLSLTPKNTD